ncbi:MAG: glycosyltransferase family 4 protein [Pseudomonadota bacterium]
MKVFFRIEYPLGSIDVKEESLGIYTANTQLLANLIKYSQVIEEYGLVVSDLSEEEKLKELFPHKVINGHEFNREDELIAVLRYYDVFFMAGYGIYDILKCEHLFQGNLSVVGITYSLSLDEIVKSIKDASKICTGKDTLICISSSAKNCVEKILGGRDYSLRLETIPLGVDINKYRPTDEATKKRLRRDFGLPDDATIFLYLGRLSPCSKMELTPFLKAFFDLTEMPECGDKTHLLVVGREHTSGYIEVLKSLATKLRIMDRVSIISSYDSSNIPLYYNVADIFVSPSDNIQETFGLTVLEAMASGLPVIATDWDGYRDTVVDGTTGFLIPTYWADCGISWHRKFQLAQSVAMDIDRLVESMRVLLENKDLRKTMGEASRRRVESKFAWEKVIKNYDTLFHRLASGSRNKSKEDSRAIADSSGIILSPVEVFKAWPTEFVTEGFRIRLRDIKGFTGYTDIIRLVDGEIVNHIANLIAKNITSVGDITRILGREREIPVHETLFQIMVMLKYGVFAPAF